MTYSDDTTHTTVPDSVSAGWTRRVWLTANMSAFILVPARQGLIGDAHPSRGAIQSILPGQRNAELESDQKRSPTDHETLVRRAVDAARHAGAQYADAKITNTVTHWYNFGDTGVTATEEVGIGVRALVNGHWGFAAVPSVELAEVDHLGEAAAAQAASSGRGLPRTVELGQIPAVTGHWATPVSIDPFTVPIEEKHAFMRTWEDAAKKSGLGINSLFSHILFARQERIVATSEGALFTQTFYESGGKMYVNASSTTVQEIRRKINPFITVPVLKIEPSGSGWELFLNADIPSQFPLMVEQLEELTTLQKSAKQAMVGRFTLVCDGATMASLLGTTLGVATQLDRALGYEANAGGTSFLDDPLAMLGNFHVGSPLVSVTANRSAPGQLATVKWDDEGVVPPETTLVKEGILHDFQTIREQASWLAPYYTKIGRPVQSNGCAASENALGMTMQCMPNLSLEAGPASLGVEDLIGNVKDGIFIEHGAVIQSDFQARNGLLFGGDVPPIQMLSGRMREIKGGRLGRILQNGAIQFNSIDIWKNIVALGGPATRMVLPTSPYPWGGDIAHQWATMPGMAPTKGEPAQATGYSVQAVAATIVNQPLIDITRKA